MFLNSIFVSSPAFLAITLVLFNFAVAFIYALHLVMPKQARGGFAVWEELVVPPLNIEGADKTVLIKTKRKTSVNRKKKCWNNKKKPHFVCFSYSSRINGLFC